ncbi:aldose 1-epimerase family protein [Adhaeribacter radiodurans]|uniref:Aldose 1-epimerase family protein n=1 Tax=Adhaeribacter radiodurans TaxID=2745197 RepID=A0A7L7L9C8_9BACT|nr:aldose 1-epimerase family protein [Adhaeribacter radiodurans]QMU29446.1 aldose 1-epimerase family protein [Adhaeribacter radiodurans]
MHTLQNNTYQISVQEHGAELCSFKNTQTNLEYIWQADPAIWARHAPVLFPMVGKLKNNQYTYQGKSYTLPQHGFARDQSFTLESKTENSLTFRLNQSEVTLANYPFDFGLFISYRLAENALTISYRVENPRKDSLYFSLGAHPGFNCPLLPDEKFSDYYLKFEQPETLERYLLNNGLQNGQTEPVPLENDNQLPLTYKLFTEKDAIVLKNLRSEKISLRSKNHDHGLDFTFKGYPYLGIWTKGQDAPFICLEPWHGIADSINSSGELTEKEGIITLPPNEVFTCEYIIAVK